VGLLFVAWDWTMRQLASNHGNEKEMAVCLWSVHSMNQQHALGVFFMGSLNFDEDSSLIRNSAMSFNLMSSFIARGGEGLACGNIGR
jgi:hypothetical protein